MHMGLAQFNSMVGARIPGVIYKGAGPALTSLLGGETQMAFISMPTVAAHIQAGKLRALAVTGERRSPAAPDLPTAGESGLPGFVLSGWYGFLAPAKTGAVQIDRLNAELRRALAHPEVRQRLLEFGAEAVASTPAEFGTFLRAEIASRGKSRARGEYPAGIARRRALLFQLRVLDQVLVGVARAEILIGAHETFCIDDIADFSLL